MYGFQMFILIMFIFLHAAKRKKQKEVPVDNLTDLMKHF